MSEHRSGPPRVMIADAQALFAQALGQALRDDHGVDVVAEFPARGHQALEAVRRHRPEVVIYDNWMLELDGPAAVAAIASQVPDTRVLVSSGYHGPHHIQAALAAGAAGFLPKGLRVAQVAEAVRRAAAGEALVFAEQLADLIDDLARRLEASRSRVMALSLLTERELEVLETLAGGAGLAAAAEMMSISEGTLKNHLHNIMSKTGARNRVELLAMARREGFVSGGSRREHGQARRRWEVAGQLEGGVSRPEGEGRNDKAPLVLVADAQRLFGEALGSALAKNDRLSVLPTVATRAHEAVDAVVSYRPDLVVYDLHLQGMETPAVLAALLRWAPATRVVLLAWYQGRPAVRRALVAAPEIIVSKSAPLDAVVEMAIAAAQRPLSHHAATVAAVADLLSAGRGGDDLGRLLSLTPKELQVLHHLAKGQPIKQAASELAMAQGTMKNLISRLTTKLGVRTQLEALSIARNAGFVCED